MKRLKNKYKAIIVLVISGISLFFAMTGSSYMYKYYIWAVFVLLSLYAIWEQMQKTKEQKELKKLRDELLEAKWKQEMENRSK